MLNHHAILSSLDAYADSSLPAAQRAEVAAHLQTCGECGESLRQIRRLDHVLNDLPAIQPVPFSHFWSRLEPRLPNHAQKRASVFRPGRLAAGFALAVIASLVGVVALASDGTMPDSPLYSVKHLRQGVQLSLADAHERPRLELFLARQRLDEAAAMLKRQRDDLAVASLRDFKTLIVDATPRLENSASKPDAAEVTRAISQIKTELTAVGAANLEPDGSSAAAIAAVDSAVQDAQKAVTQVETPAVPSEPAPTEAAAESTP
jgi:hypothetical protein